MKLINKTKWKSEDLRAIIRRVMKQMEHYGWDAACSKRLILTIVPARNRQWCSGYAYIRGRNAKVCIPTLAMTDAIKIDFASVTSHELAHIMGHHGERWMRSHPVWGRPGRGAGLQADTEASVWAWAKAMPITSKEAKAATPADAQIESKLASIEVRLKAWTAKKKRAETALKKYRRKLGYYQTRLAAIKTPNA